MPGKKKKFIDKKNAVTFHLVHRSQRDPLQADDQAPQHVLLPADPASQAVHDDTVRREEQKKYGIYYDDDYDYMQHLRSVDEVNEVGPTEVFQLQVNQDEDRKSSGILLPPKVFASAEEEQVGLLNKAAPHSGPRLDWDPEIVAALDNDFDFDNPDNQLEDDFVIQANEGHLEPMEGGDFEAMDEDDEDQLASYRPPIEVLEDDEDGESDHEGFASDEADVSDNEDDASDIGSLGDMNFNDVETKSRFTNYSMSSSVIKRNEGLTLLDDRFEKLYEQYDDTEIGALDHEDIGGCVQQGSELLNSALAEFETKSQKVTMKDVVQKAEKVNIQSESEDSSEEMVEVVVEEKPKRQYDCESILSTYSNLYNHPKVIDEPPKRKVKPINVSEKHDLPLEGLPQRGLSLKEIQQSSRPVREGCCTYRPKDESAEERRARKSAVKAERKVRREEKKANKEAFKEEKKRQKKDMDNLQKNLPGIKIN